MHYSYKIRLKIEEDAWNWYDASRQASFQGLNWRDNLSSQRDIDLFDTISRLSDVDANLYLLKVLAERYRKDQALIDRYIKHLNAEFECKFLDACKCVEKLTGKRLFTKNFEFLLTTFPRCPCDGNKGIMFFYITFEQYWVEPIDNFIHEALHSQFSHYWRQDPGSPVSKLSNDDFSLINESLTVIIDDSLKPLISHADWGYSEHAKFRQNLHKHWLRHHDFDRLVSYAMSKIA